MKTQDLFAIAVAALGLSIALAFVWIWFLLLFVVAWLALAILEFRLFSLVFFHPEKWRTQMTITRRR